MILMTGEIGYKIYENSVQSVKFFCNLKTVLKSKIYGKNTNPSLLLE